MKILFLPISLLFISVLYSQSDKMNNSDSSKFEVAYSYGISYLEYADGNPEDPLNLSVSPFGSFQELNFDFRLPKNRYIGLGLSRQQHRESIDRSLVFNDSVELLLSDYDNILQTNYIDVHFRQVFKNGFQLTFGLYYLNQTENRLQIVVFENFTGFRLSSDTINDAGIFISPEYFFDINTYFELGLKAKAYYTFGVFEAITLLPTARFKI
ncbi:hypothetical protein [Psychroflexus tropicus]|uniref:hypothetical protein n=1 Tax=Psychroflexus tropicus TaxID=197345 RepID=UPI000376F18D|nr:hypothetical protein [Psychroflexus tropicus]